MLGSMRLSVLTLVSLLVTVNVVQGQLWGSWLGGWNPQHHQGQANKDPYDKGFGAEVGNQEDAAKFGSWYGDGAEEKDKDSLDSVFDNVGQDLGVGAGSRYPGPARPGGGYHSHGHGHGQGGEDCHGHQQYHNQQPYYSHGLRRWCYSSYPARPTPGPAPVPSTTDAPERDLCELLGDYKDALGYNDTHRCEPSFPASNNELKTFQNICYLMSQEFLENCLGGGLTQDMALCISEVTQVLEISSLLNICVCHGVNEYQLAVDAMHGLVCPAQEIPSNPYDFFGLSRQKREGME